MKRRGGRAKQILTALLAAAVAGSSLLTLAQAAEQKPYNQGLWAEYYSGDNFQIYVTGKTEQILDFQWTDSNKPLPQLGLEHFSVRFSGRIFAPETGTYDLSVNIDDGAKVWLDGNLVMEDKGPHYPAVSYTQAVMEKGSYHDLVVEYYNGELGGTAQLSWKTPSGKSGIIPKENLYMPDQAAVEWKVSGKQISASARMQCGSNEIAQLVLERVGKTGEVEQRLTVLRTDANTMSWESEKMAYQEGASYKAYVLGEDGKTLLSSVQEKQYGIDGILTVNSDQTVGEVSPLLYGACMEDVNHELYGGIWSQMVYGESFAEPASTIAVQAFTSYGGTWNTKQENGVNQITVDRLDGTGPKLMIDGTQCESGVVSADVLVGGGEGPAGFVVKVTDPRIGADNFNGYEVGLLNNAVRIGAHRYNYTAVGDYPCNAPAGSWANLKVAMTKNTLTVYVNGEKAAEYTDPNPLVNGSVGFRAWNCSAQFQNIRFGADEASMKEIEIPDFSQNKVSVSGMWESVFRGGAQGELSLTKENPYKGSQSQRIVYTSGKGAVGVNNMGLNRKGMNFEKDKAYEGYFYARSDEGAQVSVVLENADGSRQYAKQAVAVSGGEWKKYAFTITPNAKDAAGRMTLELENLGTVDLGYVFLQPGEWGRYKGLPVRKDVGEALENQHLSVLRFGGCMANAEGYKWKNMLGDPETRPVYKGWWYEYSSFGFGIVEFLNLCEALGVVGIPDFNGHESAQDMADFIDFATGTDKNNPWVQKRIEMGHPEPYKLPYLQYGNEEKVNLDFASRFNAAAKAIWEKDDDIILVVGDFAYQQPIGDPYNFTGADSGITSLEGQKAILDQAVKYDREVWFDVHVFTETQGNSHHYFEALTSFYYQLKQICPDAKVKLPIFEFNANTHDVERALENAYGTAVCERLSEIFPIVCSANSLQVDGHNDNAWNQGLVFMDNDSAWMQPPGYVTGMFYDAYQPNLVEARLTPWDQNLSVTATASDDGKTVVLKFVNQNKSSKNVQVDLGEFTGNQNSGTIRVLKGAAKAVNTADNKQAVVPTSQTLENPVQNGKMTIKLDAYSLTVLELTAQSDPEPPVSSEEQSSSEPGSESDGSSAPESSKPESSSDESVPPQPESSTAGENSQSSTPDGQETAEEHSSRGEQSHPEEQKPANPTTGGTFCGGALLTLAAASCAFAVYKKRKA